MTKVKFIELVEMVLVVEVAVVVDIAVVRLLGWDLAGCSLYILHHPKQGQLLDT